MTRAQTSWLAITTVVLASFTGCASKRTDVMIAASDGTVCAPLSGEPGEVVPVTYLIPHSGPASGWLLKEVAITVGSDGRKQFVMV